jgi:hypothetical protein
LSFPPLLDLRGIAAVGQLVYIRRENANTAVDQRQDPELPGDELAGKTARIFHDDNPLMRAEQKARRIGGPS